jgi:cyclopropane fatty-acyl-phospholipid synthase-like methyltransferase
MMNHGLILIQVMTMMKSSDTTRADYTPENAKSFFPEIRTPQKGTLSECVVPPKTQKAFFRK